MCASHEGCQARQGTARSFAVHTTRSGLAGILTPGDVHRAAFSASFHYRTGSAIHAAKGRCSTAPHHGTTWCGFEPGDTPAGLEAAAGIMTNDLIIGLKRYRDQRGVYGVRQEDLPFSLSAGDRRHHLYMLGKTGTGKSTLLESLIVQDLAEGRGVGLIDPHGELAEAVLEHVPSHRTREVVYFNPGDVDRPVGFNLLRKVPRPHRPLIASTVLSAFQSIWSDSWGPRLEYILYNAVAALLEAREATLLGVLRMLTDGRYRGEVLDQVDDPVVRAFWVDEYERYDKRFRTDAIAPIQNKVGQLLAHPPLRNILAQKTSSFDPRFTMDTGRIFIANLSKGRIGERGANLLGSLLVSYFGLAAMQRVDTPAVERRDFHLYVDEFHNFTTSAFASILAEARKYGLSLTLAHQYLDQLDEEVRAAVFGNVGTLIAFRLGLRDAELLAPEFGEALKPADLADVGWYKTHVRAPDAGPTTRPLVLSTFPPSGEGSATRRERVIRHSRERFGTPRRRVEEQVNRWMRHAA